MFFPIVIISVATFLLFLHLLRSGNNENLRPEPSQPSVRRRRVAVVGAGPAGIVMLRELAEAGHDAVAFEAAGVVGGAFAAAYDDCLLTTSAANTAFSSLFPEKEEQHRIWTAREYVAYLEHFIGRHRLWDRIRLSTRVVGVRSVKTSRGEDRWEVTLRKAEDDGDGETTTTEHFEHLAVCTGANATYELPQFKDQERFGGSIIHTAQYRNSSDLAGKRVLVVGLGESGSDIALQAAQVASATALSTRNGPGYVIPRTLMGRPTDLDTNRMYHSIPRRLWGRWYVRGKVRLENLLARLRPGRSDDFAVLDKAREINESRMPRRSVMQRFATKNASFVEALLKYRALYKPEVRHLSRDSAIFEDGSSFRCDVIICATGFKLDFPWLPDDINQVARTPRRLFKSTFHPGLGARLAFGGFARPNVGAIPPLAEMQARLYALVVSGVVSLPPAEQMEAIAAADNAGVLAQFPEDAPRIQSLTDYLSLLDDLAGLVGCAPPLASLHLADLARVMCAPLSGPQFRLAGPGAAPQEAREALRRMETMPLPVLLMEAAILAWCKLRHWWGHEDYRPVGVCGGSRTTMPSFKKY